MMKPIYRLLSGIARSRMLPASIRRSYALALKRAWRLLPSPVVAEVDGVGLMWLDPWDFLDARLFFFRTWEPTMSAYFAVTLKPGDVVVDVGANIGYYSLLASRAVGPAGVVYAIEPSPDIRARLQRNIRLNSADNIQVVPYGISNRSERRVFTLARGNLGASKFGAEVAEGGLELRQLIDVIAPEVLARVTLIKVDVEGMEAAVLSDVAELLPKLSPNVVVASELRRSPEIEQILARFESAGFGLLLLENDYSMYAYAAGQVSTPRMIATLPEGQHDVALVPAGRARPKR
jgi:FkbM family methyltransferase